MRGCGQLVGEPAESSGSESAPAAQRPWRPVAGAPGSCQPQPGWSMGRRRSRRSARLEKAGEGRQNKDVEVRIEKKKKEYYATFFVSGWWRGLPKVCSIGFLSSRTVLLTFGDVLRNTSRLNVRSTNKVGEGNRRMKSMLGRKQGNN